ncbi:hypothetical protein J2848_000067 [Azospirillum lipoferum]|uniref:hypothetical protein n=1 Tax=Azospirillum TaxID=191 RepID=UPI00147918D1|nr:MULTISPECIES: hypothetical protein [Azospirillum]MCP1608431.1 hypothetical protein [Azospirillum lipoferum]MDW5536248.1 hypothetical protein [Azospirillum sp. NL1]
MIVQQNLTEAQADEIVQGALEQYGKDLPVQKLSQGGEKWTVVYIPPGQEQENVPTA